MTAPSAARSGLAFSSSTSDWSSTVSSSLSRLVPLMAETSTSRTSPPIELDEDLVLEKLGAHALRIGVRLVDLVDGDDDRHLGRLGVIDRLDGLRHDAVVGGHHQDDDVGNVGAAGAHGGEGGVAGRVDEGDLLAVALDLVGADVLGDAAGLAGDHIGLADGVEQRRLAVVDVAHDGDHRRTRLEFGLRRPAGRTGPR